MTQHSMVCECAECMNSAAASLPSNWKYDLYRNTLHRDDGLAVAAARPFAETIRQVEMSELRLREQSANELKRLWTVEEDADSPHKWPQTEGTDRRAPALSGRNQFVHPDGAQTPTPGCYCDGCQSARIESIRVHNAGFVVSTEPQTVQWSKPLIFDSWGEDATAGSAVVEVRPPPEYATQTWHWIDCLSHGPMPLEWCASEQAWWMRGGFVRPAGAARRSWRYLGPAEYRPRKRVLVMGADGVLRGHEYDEALAAKDTRIAELERDIGIYQSNVRERAVLLERQLKKVAELEADLDRLRSAQIREDAAEYRGSLRAAQGREKNNRASHEPGRVVCVDTPPTTASQTAPPQKGEFITCERGHLVCEVVGELMPHWDAAGAAWPGLGAWRANADKNGLCECGKPWFRYQDGIGCIGPRLHVKGRGWVIC